MVTVIQFVLGLLFGVGLLLAGMANPAKVLNFLDLAAIPTGGWDPSLLLVMGGAVGVTALGYGWVLGWRHPLLADRFALPTARGVEARLVLGPALFGVGWGLAGFCPGPALVALGTGAPAALAFVLAMAVGMALARRLADQPTAPQPTRPQPTGPQPAAPS